MDGHRHAWAGDKRAPRRNAPTAQSAAGEGDKDGGQPQAD